MQVGSLNRHNVGVETGIGPTLREARNRRKLDLSQVEAAIKIRVRYLQAIENEEWDALPGGAYTRGFIRTYANHLGLDGDRLAEDYKRSTMPPGGERPPKRVEPVPTGARPPRRTSGWVAIALVSLALVGLVVAIALAGGGGGGDDSQAPTPAAKTDGDGAEPRPQTTAGAARPGIALRLAATAEVWVCLLDAAGEPLVEGRILDAGEEAGPYRSKGFEMAFGNGSVDLYVDGDPAAVEESSSPVGYAVDSDGRLTALEEGERPSCE
jgi:hypothetical protein